MIKKRLMILVGVVALVALVFSVTACAPSGPPPVEPTHLTIATGGTAGTYYPLGGAMATIITNYAENVEATAIPTGASAVNARMIGEKTAQLVLLQNDVALYAQQGMYDFEEAPVEDIRGVASLYPETIQIVTLKEYGIKTLSDLKGKKVGIGAPGSGTAIDILQIFELAGIDETNTSFQWLDFAECAMALKDKTIDVGCHVAGFPTSGITEVAASRDIGIVEVPTDIYNQLKVDYPFYVQITIPAGTYTGLDEDVNSVAVLAMIGTGADVPEDAVYEATKAIFEHTDILIATHKKGEQITLETALDGMSIPVHPGAAQYFEEQGLVVPTF